MTPFPALLGLALTLFSLGTLAQGVAVEIYNNTGVDLCVDGQSRQDCKAIPSRQSGHVSMRSAQWIQFGMNSYRYNIPKVWFKPGLKLQAEADGNLYLLPPEAKAPVPVLPKQPGGFPLSPTRKVDLT